MANSTTEKAVLEEEQCGGFFTFFIQNELCCLKKLYQFQWAFITTEKQIFLPSVTLESTQGAQFWFFQFW